MVTVSRLTGVATAALAASLLVSAQPITFAQTATAKAVALQTAAVQTTPLQTTPLQTGPTFTKDVLPIMQRSCQPAHPPDTPAPISLMTYPAVRPGARSIKTRVVNREMPPWHIDRSFGKYANDPSLSD